MQRDGQHHHGGALQPGAGSLCLLAPLAEEGVFRGAVQRRAQPLGRGQAILLQAVLFALQHGSVAAMVYALVCGLGLGWLADRTGHLWPGMLLHSANNLLVLAMDERMGYMTDFD